MSLLLLVPVFAESTTKRQGGISVLFSLMTGWLTLFLMQILFVLLWKRIYQSIQN